MERINIEKIKMRETREIELKQDLIVPDSKQDIFQIKEQNYYSYFTNIQISNGKIDLSGNVDVRILYFSSGDENVGLQTTINFNDNISNSEIQDNMTLRYNIKVQKQEIKIINERKISILLTLEVAYEVFYVDSIEIDNEFPEIEDVQINSKKANIHSLVGSGSNIANFKEEMKIESTDIVSSIINVNTQISKQEVKISHNKVLTKADLEVNIKYLTNDERIVEVQEKYPMMSFIDIENVKEDNSCTTDYQVRNIFVNPSENEDNNLLIQMEYEILCKAFEEKEYEIVNDLYSLKYDLDFSKKEISSNSGEKIEVVQNVVKKELASNINDSMIVYSVKKNDSLWDISKKFKVNKDSVIKSNELEEPYFLKPGEKIYIVR